MAVDVCSVSEVLISPRISFSHDLKNQSSDIFSSPVDQIQPIRSDQFLVTTTASTFDFDFCITSNLHQQISSADELFSNGKILPTQIKKLEEKPKPAAPAPSGDSTTDTQKKSLKEFLFHEEEEEEDEGEEHQEQEQGKSSLRSFWQFRRSTSLNCDNGRSGSKGLLRSLSLKGLSRSNSTGSAPNPKRNVAPPKVIEKSNSQKQKRMLSRSSSLPQTPPSSYLHYYGYNNGVNNNSTARRPPLKKNCRGGYGGGGIRISPVLNIPPAYGTMNLFGLASLFCNGKSKKKSK